MSLIWGLLAVWIVLSVLGVGSLYIASTGDTEAVSNPTDWEAFERQ